MTAAVTEFLNARLDEDEVGARGLLAHNAASRARGLASTLWDEQDQDTQRTLREVAAKRAIVTRYAAVRRAFGDREGGLWPDVSRREKSHAYATLCDLAGIWSDHPDYRDEWAS